MTTEVGIFLSLWFLITFVHGSYWSLEPSTEYSRETKHHAKESRGFAFRSFLRAPVSK